MPDISTGYSPGPGGYYKLSDRSGPYCIDSSAVATLRSAASGGGAPSFILREDGSYLLREDGARFVRETF